MEIATLIILILMFCIPIFFFIPKVFNWYSKDLHDWENGEGRYKDNDTS